MRHSLAGIQIFLAALIICLATAIPIRAGFLIEGNATPTSVSAGSTADINFYITSNNNDQLGSFQLVLQITKISGSGFLSFTSDVNNQLNAYDPANTNYVFASNSYDAYPPASTYWNSVTSTTTNNDTITGGDTAITTFTFPNSTSSYLLATVQVDASNAAAGDSYQIAVVPSSGLGGTPSSPTYFLDTNSPSYGDSDYVAYDSTPVTVDVVPLTTAVPEPSSLALSIFGLTSLLYSWRGRRKAHVASA